MALHIRAFEKTELSSREASSQGMTGVCDSIIILVRVLLHENLIFIINSVLVLLIYLNFLL